MAVEKLVGAPILVKSSSITMIMVLDGTTGDGTTGDGIRALDGTVGGGILDLDGITGPGTLVLDGTMVFMAMDLDGTIGGGMLTTATSFTETTAEIILMAMPIRIQEEVQEDKLLITIQEEGL